MRLEDVFQTDDRRRDKFLARVFGIFSVDVVHHWCGDPRAPYDDLGRPSLYDATGRYLHTLDFTLRCRADGRVSVAELKCELEFDNYAYLRLTDEKQLRAERRAGAFRAFLELAREPRAYTVKAARTVQQISGAILVWGATTPQGADAVEAECGFADVLSVESMLNDLSSWQTASWILRVQELEAWTNFLLSAPGR